MPLRLERICGKKCEQRVDPLVQSAATPAPPVRRELNDVWSLYGARRARLSRLGERRQEAGIRVHRPPPSIGVTAAPLGRVSQRETLIGIKNWLVDDQQLEPVTILKALSRHFDGQVEFQKRQDP
jgi:hypothetical protein